MNYNHTYELRRERAGILHMHKTTTPIGFVVTLKQIGAFVFAI